MGIESLKYIRSFFSLVHTFSHTKDQTGNSNPDQLCVRDVEGMQNFQAITLELANNGAGVASVLHGDEARGRKAGAPHAAQQDSVVTEPRGRPDGGRGVGWKERRVA